GNVSSGMIIGINTGVIIGAGGAQSGAVNERSLHDALDQIQQRAATARGAGDEELHDDLQVVALSIQAAIKAPANSEPRAGKLGEARRSLEPIAQHHPELQAIAGLLGKL